MKKIFIAVIFIILLITPFYDAAAQTVFNEPDMYENTFLKADHPQWVKDVRRFDIIAFGSFPFAFFFTTFFHDMARWNRETGMDMSDEGRRYAPWPLKSAGAVDFTTEEFRKNVLMSIGVALGIAAADMIIYKTKQIVQRKRAESRPPTGIYTIEQTRMEADKDWKELLENKINQYNEKDKIDIEVEIDIEEEPEIFE